MGFENVLEPYLKAGTNMEKGVLGSTDTACDHLVSTFYTMLDTARIRTWWTHVGDEKTCLK